MNWQIEASNQSKINLTSTACTITAPTITINGDTTNPLTISKTAIFNAAASFTNTATFGAAATFNGVPTFNQNAVFTNGITNSGQRIISTGSYKEFRRNLGIAAGASGQDTIISWMGSDGVYIGEFKAGGVGSRTYLKQYAPSGSSNADEFDFPNTDASTTGSHAYKILTTKNLVDAFSATQVTFTDTTDLNDNEFIIPGIYYFGGHAFSTDKHFPRTESNAGRGVLLVTGYYTSSAKYVAQIYMDVFYGRTYMRSYNSANGGWVNSSAWKEMTNV